MKTIFKALIIIVLFPVFGFAQNMEIRLGTGINVPYYSLFEYSKKDWLAHTGAQSYASFSTNVDFNYHFRSGKKLDFFIGSGVNFNRYKFIQRVESFNSRYNLHSISIKEDFLTIPIRLGVEYMVNDKSSIGFQYALGYSVPLSKMESLSGSGTQVWGSVDYSYLLERESKGSFNHSFDLFLKTKLSKNVSLFGSVGYSFQGQSKYKYSTEQHNKVSSLTNMTRFSDDYGILNHGKFNFTIGVSYAF